MVDRLLASLPFGPWRKRGPLVNVLKLSGVIAAQPVGRETLSLSALAGDIERAFKPKDLAAVALVINSPGGAPAQSALIHRRIRAFAAERKVPILSFCEDVAASGGYWLALAGDEVFADDTSIIGSIGVISASFGFENVLKRWGVERRVYTAGSRKSLLDPFRAVDPEDVARLRNVQDDLHESFKDLVREARGARLKGSEGQLFSGEFWTGRQALHLGLIDGIGEVRSVLRSRFGEDVRIAVIGQRRRRRWPWRLPWSGMASGVRLEEDLGRRLVDGALAALEERAHWGRFGL